MIICFFLFCFSFRNLLVIVWVCLCEYTRALTVSQLGVPLTFRHARLETEVMVLDSQEVLEAARILTWVEH